MSSGFVTETELADQRRVRQAEWERVRTDDQPLEAPEETYDARPLYQRLEEQKQKKDAEYEEAHKLKNMIRGLDDDEVGFLDLVEHTKAAAARQISLEEKREMEEFRQRVSTLQETAEKERLAQQISSPALKKKPTNGNNNTRNMLQGVIVRKRKVSEVSDGDHEAKNKSTKLDQYPAQLVENGSKPVNKSNFSESSKADGTDGGLKCIGVLPGLGHYNDDTSDSDNSSDSDECSPTKRYDLCGRLQDKKNDNKN